MKKLFTIDDFMVAFVASMGYGFGDAISKLMGWPELIGYGLSFILGVAAEGIINRIVYSEAVQKKRSYRIFVYVTIILVFLAGHYFSVTQMGVSMFEYLGGQIVSVVCLPVLGFIFNLIIRAFRTKRIRKLYGDGSGGYVFNVDNKDIDMINKQNQPVVGEYDTDCAVKTRTGIYIGTKHKEGFSYLGIPYAKPPLGELRWKAPEPLPSSENVFEAKNFGASAIQFEHKGSILKLHRQNEDCLTLNIGVGSQKTADKKPVLVLFHQGDFSYGGSADPLLYGGNFTENHQDIVFVSFNYRLGIFGFIDFSEIPGGEVYPDAINLGLLDQIAALKWIKENISAFGGDPERITVIGFESGATSICLLAASEQAKGLFQKAFVFFGSPGAAYVTPESSRALAQNLLNETQTKSMDELLQLKTGDLRNAAQKFWPNTCAPTCDGSLVPVDVYKAYQDGAASGIEFIFGIPGNEGMVFRSIVGDQKYEDYISELMTDLQNHTDDSLNDAIQAYIRDQTSSMGELEAKSKLIEQWQVICMYKSAVKLMESGNKVYLMYWDEKPLIENLGSGTVDAAAALLGNGEALEMYGSLVNEDQSLILQNLLEKFIKGNALYLYPNEIKGFDGIEWKSFPLALIVSDGKLQCDTIDDRLAEIKKLLDAVAE